MLADTPLVKNLRNDQYRKILLQDHPTLESLFAEIDPASIREELQIARANPEKTPKGVRQFIADLPNATPIKLFLEQLKSNRISRS